MTNRILELLGSAASNQPSNVAPEQAIEAAEATKQKAKRVLMEAERVVKTHPVAALSVAIVAGVAVAWWVKRK